MQDDIVVLLIRGQVHLIVLNTVVLVLLVVVTGRFLTIVVNILLWLIIGKLPIITVKVLVVHIIIVNKSSFTNFSINYCFHFKQTNLKSNCNLKSSQKLRQGVLYHAALRTLYNVLILIRTYPLLIII